MIIIDYNIHDDDDDNIINTIICNLSYKQKLIFTISVINSIRSTAGRPLRLWR